MLITLFSLALSAAPLHAGQDTVPTPMVFQRSPGSVIVHHQPSLPVVALRLSLLADDPPGYAGAGHLVQHLALPTLEEQVRRVGGRIQAARSPDALIYTVVGPAEELEFLAGVLEGALQTPTPSSVEMLSAHAALLGERMAEWETANSHVRSMLRTHLFPQELPAPGTERSASHLTAERLAGVWAQMYHPARVSVVAVGDVRVPDVYQVFGNLPLLATEPIEAMEPDTVPLAPLAIAQATRGWIGLGYGGVESSLATQVVTARLLKLAIEQRLPTASVEVEPWWTHRGRALAVVVAAPEPVLAEAHRVAGAALSTLRGVSRERVRAVAEGLRRELLFHSRTPEHMAEVIGQFVDRGASPEEAQRFFTDLAAVRPQEVERLLESLARQTPVRVDIAPQQTKKP